MHQPRRNSHSVSGRGAARRQDQGHRRRRRRRQCRQSHDRRRTWKAWSSSRPTPISRRSSCRKAPVKLQLGVKLTNGLGAGANPGCGPQGCAGRFGQDHRGARRRGHGFITAGLGGGTGTGAAPVIASLASEMGALTVAVVTRPFAFEGKRRRPRRSAACRSCSKAWTR